MRQKGGDSFFTPAGCSSIIMASLYSAMITALEHWSCHQKGGIHIELRIVHI